MVTCRAAAPRHSPARLPEERLRLRAGQPLPRLPRQPRPEDGDRPVRQRVRLAAHEGEGNAVVLRGVEQASQWCSALVRGRVKGIGSWWALYRTSRVSPTIGSPRSSSSSIRSPPAGRPCT